MRSAPAKIPFPCWSQSWVSLRTAFGPCSAAGSAHELLALLRPHHHLLYPPCFPQSRHIGMLLRVFCLLWHASSYALNTCKTSICGARSAWTTRAGTTL